MKKRTRIRFRQILTAIVLSLLILAGGIRVNALASSSVRTGEMSRNYTSVMVHPGDSLWSIARTWSGYTGDEELRKYVDELRRMNHLDADGTIYPGAYLMISVPME